MARIHILLLAAAAATTATALPTTRNTPVLAAGTDTCASGQEACPSALPDTFCCPASYTCMALAGDTTAVCCPPGADCAKISPITCNVEQQDPEKNPKAPIKTSVFDVALDKCGSDACCPFGYECVGGNECRLKEDQEAKPGEEKGGKKDEEVTTSSSSSEGGTSSATVSRTASFASETMTETELPIITSGPGSDGDDDGGDARADPSTGDESSASRDKDASGPDTMTIIGGVVGGVAALLALAVVIFVCARRRAAKNANKTQLPSSSSSSPPSAPPGKTVPVSIATRGISGPTFDNGQEPLWRSDFARRAASAAADGAPSISDADRDDGGAMREVTAARHQSIHPRVSTVTAASNPFGGDDSPSSASPSSSSSSHGSPSSRCSVQSVTNGRIVGGRLAPIRGMRPSSAVRTIAPLAVRKNRPGKDDSDDDGCDGRSINIDVFADPVTLDRQRGRAGSTVTTFSRMMDQAKGTGTERSPRML